MVFKGFLMVFQSNWPGIHWKFDQLAVVVVVILDAVGENVEFTLLLKVLMAPGKFMIINAIIWVF